MFFSTTFLSASTLPAIQPWLGQWITVGPGLLLLAQARGMVIPTTQELAEVVCYAAGGLLGGMLSLLCSRKPAKAPGRSAARVLTISALWTPLVAGTVITLTPSLGWNFHLTVTLCGLLGLLAEGTVGLVTRLFNGKNNGELLALMKSLNLAAMGRQLCVKLLKGLLDTVDRRQADAVPKPKDTET